MTVLNDTGFLTLNHGGQKEVSHFTSAEKRELSTAISISRQIILLEAKTFSGERT